MIRMFIMLRIFEWTLRNEGLQVEMCNMINLGINRGKVHPLGIKIRFKECLSVDLFIKKVI